MERQPCLKVIGPRKYSTSTDEAYADFKKVSLQIVGVIVFSDKSASDKSASLAALA